MNQGSMCTISYIVLPQNTTAATLLDLGHHELCKFLAVTILAAVVLLWLHLVHDDLQQAATREAWNELECITPVWPANTATSYALGA